MTYTQVKKAIKEIGKDELRDLIGSLGEEVIKAGQEAGFNLSTLKEAYQGQYNSDKDFAYEMAESLGSIEKVVQWPYTCIDWEFAAKELMYDYTEQNGHYFRNL